MHRNVWARGIAIACLCETFSIHSVLGCVNVVSAPALSNAGPTKGDDAYLEGPLAVLFKLGQNIFRSQTKQHSAEKDVAISDKDLKAGGYGRSRLKNMNSTEILNLRLWIAAEAGNARAVKDFLKKGANVNWRETRSWYLWSPLHVAAVDGHVEVVDALHSAGADVNILDWDQWTPLHYAAYQGLHKHAQVARRLLDFGANVFEQTWDGSTASTLARKYNHSEVVALLETFEQNEARRRGMFPRRNTLDKYGMRKDREQFLYQLTRPYVKKDNNPGAQAA